MKTFGDLRRMPLTSQMNLRIEEPLTEETHQYVLMQRFQRLISSSHSPVRGGMNYFERMERSITSRHYDRGNGLTEYQIREIRKLRQRDSIEQAT